MADRRTASGRFADLEKRVKRVEWLVYVAIATQVLPKVSGAPAPEQVAAVLLSYL